MLFKRSLSRFGLTLASIVLTLGLVEGLSRLLDVVSPPFARSREEFRRGLPPPYHDAPFDVQELMDEVSSVKWSTAETYGWLPLDRSGKYVNIVNNLRLTTDAPALTKNTVWVFGGSTVIGGKYLTGTR